MADLGIEPAISYAIDRLRNELSPDLSYHNLWHTVEDVMPAAVRLANRYDLGAEEVNLLRVASAYHDIGYVRDSQNHELIGVRIAAQKLPQFGLSSGQIETVLGMIIATRLPQSPRNLLEEILADADLDVLGRDDFMKRSNDLRRELQALGQTIPEPKWVEQQYNFLRSHKFFTEAAREVRDGKKEQHLRSLQLRLNNHRH